MQTASGTSKRFKNTCRYNSLNEKFKRPFGAVATREKITLTFPVDTAFGTEEAIFVLRRNDHNTRYPLVYSRKEDGCDVFCLEFDIEREGTYFYRFELRKQGRVYFVGKGRMGEAIIGEWLPEWQLSVYGQGYETPAEFKSGVVYHIFVDRFCKLGEDVHPKHGILKQWSEDVTVVDSDGVYRANDFFGGNFKGILSKLDYLSKLGVSTIYLSPIFESSSNHRYDTGDYHKIDPLLGTETDFGELIYEAQKHGIGIMLDGVFNHTGADSIYFNKFGHYPSLGAYQSKDSPYYDWYTFLKFPDEYRCWWGVTVVPTVTRDAKGYHELIAGKSGILKKWTDFGVKGWRLDVVDELSGNFVRGIRQRIKQERCDCVLIGEVWEDASTKFSYGEEREYFRGNELDGVMNYIFKDAILTFLDGGRGEDFAETVMCLIENYPKQSLDCCMTLIDSHDTVRALNALSGENLGSCTKMDRLRHRLTPNGYARGKEKLKLASCLQYFLPGVPTVYYGDEVGMQGYEDPINRRPFPWQNIDNDLLSHYRYLGQLRKTRSNLFLERPFVEGTDGHVTIRRAGIVLSVDRIKNTFTLDFPTVKTE